MKDSRLKNAKRNIVGAAVNQAVKMLIPFLTRTIIIYYLGIIYLGLNSLFGSLLTMLSLAELGVGSAMVFSMYEPIAKGDNQMVCALLNLYRKIYRIIGSVILGLGLLMLPFLSYIIKGDVPEDISIYVLYLIFLTGTVLSYFLYGYKESVLIASQRADITSNVHSITSISGGLIQVLVLLLTRNYYAFCLVLLFVNVGRNLVINYITKRKYPEYICTGTVTKSTLNDIKKRVAGLFIYKICYVLRDSISSIIISAFLGLIVLGTFNNYYYIISTVTGFLVIIKTSISASVGNSMIEESIEKNFKDFQICQLLYMYISVWCTACLFCLIQPFITVWIGKEYLLSNVEMAICCIYFFCYKMGDVCAVYRQAAGLWWQDRYRPIVEAIVNLVLSLILVQSFGVVGVLLSSIFCLIFINSFWASNILFKHYFRGFRQKTYIVRIAFYFGVAILVCTFTNFICKFMPYDGVINLILRILVCVVVPPIIIFCFLRLLPEFNASLSFFKRLLK